MYEDDVVAKKKRNPRDKKKREQQKRNNKHKREARLVTRKQWKKERQEAKNLISLLDTDEDLDYIKDMQDEIT